MFQQCVCKTGISLKKRQLLAHWIYVQLQDQKEGQMKIQCFPLSFVLFNVTSTVLKICCYVQAPINSLLLLFWVIVCWCNPCLHTGRNATLGMQEEMLIFWLELCLGHFPAPVQQDAIPPCYDLIAVATTKPQSWSTKLWVIWKLLFWSNPFCHSCCNLGQSNTKCLKCVNSPTWIKLHDKISQRRSHKSSTARTKPYS